jgi:hypothetical protein
MTLAVAHVAGLARAGNEDGAEALVGGERACELDVAGDVHGDLGAG